MVLRYIYIYIYIYIIIICLFFSKQISREGGVEITTKPTQKELNNPKKKFLIQPYEFSEA
jgi:hypothetical protein